MAKWRCCFIFVLLAMWSLSAGFFEKEAARIQKQKDEQAALMQKLSQPAGPTDTHALLPYTTTTPTINLGPAASSSAVIFQGEGKLIQEREAARRDILEEEVRAAKMREELRERFFAVEQHPLFLAANDKLREAVRGLFLVQQDAQSYRAEAAQAAQLFHKIYQELSVRFVERPFPTRVTDITNYQSAAYRMVVATSLRDLAQRFRLIREKDARKKPLADDITAYDSAVALYDAEIAGEQGLYRLFDIPSSLAADYKQEARAAFMNERNKIVYRAYSTFLAMLAQSTKKPVEGPAALPESYYRERVATAERYDALATTAWSAELQDTGAASATQAFKMQKNNLGMLYSYLADHAIKALAVPVTNTERMSVLAENRARLVRAQEAYEKASRVYELLKNEAPYDQFYALYREIAQNLLRGLTLYDVAADQAQARSVRIASYKQASDSFVAAGAMIMGNVALREALLITSSLHEEEGLDAVRSIDSWGAPTAELNSVRNWFSRAVASYTAGMTAYQKSLSLNEQAVLIGFDPANSIVAEKNAVLGTVLSTSDKVVKSLTLLAQAFDLLEKDYLASGRALSLFSQAFILLESLDGTQNERVLYYVPLLKTIAPFAAMIKRWCAAALLSVVASLKAQLESSAQKGALYYYYTILYGMRSVLDQQVRETVIAELQKVDILRQAMSARAEAQKINEWQSSTSGVYQSKASIAWDNALTAAWIACLVLQQEEKKQAVSLYRDVMQEYKILYQKNVPEEFDKEFFGALLSYRLYLLALIIPDEGLKTDATDSIQKYSQDLSLRAQQYVQLITSSQDLLARFTALKNLVDWQKRFVATLSLQDSVLNDVRFAQPVSLLSLKKENEKDIYLFDMADQKVITRDTQELLITLYKQKLQEEKGRENTKDVVQTLLELSRLYTAAGLFDAKLQVDKELERYRLVYSAERLAQSVKGIGENNKIFPGFIVYAKYVLDAYSQSIPSEIALPAAVKDFIFQLAKVDVEEQRSLQEDMQRMDSLYSDLLVVARATSLHQALKINNVLGYLKGKSVTDLIGDAQAEARESHETIRRYLKDTRLAGDRLAVMVRKGAGVAGSRVKTKLMLFSPASGQAQLVFGNKFIPAIPEIASGKAWDPTALSTYTRAAELFTKAGEAQKSLQAQRSAALCFLSHAYTIKKRIDFLRGAQEDEEFIYAITADDEEWQVLKEVRLLLQKAYEQRALSNLNELQKAVSFVANYYAIFISDIQSTFAEVFTEEETKKLHFFTAQAYEELGDFFARHLTGDPLDPVYKSWLTQTSSSYLLAQGAYHAAGKSDLLNAVGVKIMKLFERTGDAVLESGRFMQSLGYYQAAIDCYQRTSAVDRDVVVERLTTKSYAAQYRGATDRIVSYRSKRFGKTIDIFSGSGQAPLIDFISLVKEYQESKNASCIALTLGGFGGCPSHALLLEKAYQDMAETILDSLVFYSTVAYATQTARESLRDNAQQKIYTFIEGQAVFMPLIAQEKKKLEVAAQPSDAKGAAPSVEQLMQEPARMALTKLFQQDDVFASVLPDALMSICRQGFDFCMNLDDRTMRLASLSTWSSLLFSAISVRYMHDYFGAQQPQEQLSNFVAALKAHKNNLFAPAEQYVGSLQE